MDTHLPIAPDKYRRTPARIPYAALPGLTAGEYTHKYIMPTSVHIPPALLKEVDKKAQALKISRNRLIVQALEREMKVGPNWSPAFFTTLACADPDVAQAAAEMLDAIATQRQSKKPVRF